MNALRAFSQDLMRFFDIERASKTPQAGVSGLQAVRQAPVPAVVRTGLFQDGFDRQPQGVGRTFAAAQPMAVAFKAKLQAVLGDGFDGGRRSPVDLSGGSRAPAMAPASDAPAAARAAAPAFTASLGDLLGL